ncbi:type II toxin-antitoxin system HicB family antitoxin [Massiliimalia timonensis]|uniref:type II toxin-antitoxin system HicB family antitoxin n=1 Tax=Massiliimalia timonensis TaxID=1987501 RepID=UPI000B8B1D50|nr:type II toxin-antitoxin system HicB family antitoxin [Massiliimalia timonensis]MBS7174618.1 type II toxin-antitoxin system HicB family antitoxin [Clostridiales bacterium]
MKKLFYPAVFHPEDTGYSVFVPDIDGCFSQGDTLEEAIEMVTDAIGLCLEEFSERQEEVPQPSNPKNVTCEPEDFIALIEFDWIAYQKKHDTKSVKKTLTIPSWLNTLAEEQHINFSGVLQSALKQQLNIDR